MKPRKSVRKFAKLMEKVLQSNDHKGGWQDEDFIYLWNRLIDEMEELGCQLKKTTLDKKGIIKETVDIANFCMMIAENIKMRK